MVILSFDGVFTPVIYLARELLEIIERAGGMNSWTTTRHMKSAPNRHSMGLRAAV